MKNFRWTFVFILWQILLLLLIFIIITDLNIQQSTDRNRVLPFPIVEKSITYYPVLKTDLNQDKSSDISALAAVVIDDDSKTLLFSKNPTLLLSMASTTKIMTALVALSYYKMNEVLTIQNNIVDGAKIGFEKGQKLMFEDLLYAMLLPSANDAAIAIAQNYPGGESAFVNKMNEFAKTFHLYNTRFGDTAGLLDEKGYTTPLDLARLTSVALKNKVFAKVVETKRKDIFDADRRNSYSLNNLNKLLGTDGVKGVKTGYTDEAGQVLVTSKDEEGHIIITVVMGSADRFSDTKKLLSLISGNVNYLSIHP